ncbi:hypothetical protein BJV82DRAFT_580413 [Fennellomyces sp. T-0311]|nr:hypothetical protein BJV82DRAFT_580413 [Fennellomyces sp. T-0311]
MSQSFTTVSLRKPKRTRKLSQYNFFTHLVFNGTDDERQRQALIVTVERQNIIEAWRRDITSKVRMMGEIFDCDIILMISPRNPEDPHAEVALATTVMFIYAAQYALREMGDVDRFVQLCEGKGNWFYYW